MGRACLGVVSAVLRGSPADVAQRPDPAGDVECGEGWAPSPSAVLGAVPEKGQSPVSPASGPEELLLLHKQPGPIALLMGSGSSHRPAVRPWVGPSPSLKLALCVMGMGYL